MHGRNERDKQPEQTSSRRTRRREPKWRKVAKRVGWYAFVGVMCGHIGGAYSVYDQTREEVAAKEAKLAELRAEEQRIERKLRYLETPDGREVEAFKHGWIPPGHRLLILPPVGKSGVGQESLWQPDEPRRNPLRKAFDAMTDTLGNLVFQMMTRWKNIRAER